MVRFYIHSYESLIARLNEAPLFEDDTIHSAWHATHSTFCDKSQEVTNP